jgi:hypothetical protein
MAQIVLGIGTSHSPLLAIGSELWVERGKDDLKRSAIPLSDGRTVSYQDLSREVADRYAPMATAENFRAQHRRAQDALDRLAFEIAEAAPDVVIIVGDDQDELFGTAQLPAIAIYRGEEIVMHPKSEVQKDLPEWYLTANRSYLMDKAHRYPASPDLATKIIVGLMDEGVDVASASEVTDPIKAGFGHAYGFVIQRLFPDHPIPVVPVMLNTYFPPNVPRPGRCYDIGRALRRTVESLPQDKRVAIVASGGLSHFYTDTGLDERVLEALRTRDSEVLRSLPMAALRSGSSEILNWVLAAGALEGLRVSWTEYVPVHRTPAGTGVGLGFALWKPPVARKK